jgi:ABC-type dipeptide/oligopeptide/nickel transport system ATPase subunit
LLIKALIANPHVLILDELTSGIDTPILNLILLKLREFIEVENKTVLLVTQDLQFAKSSGDRIAYMAGGTLSRFYSITEFFENTPVSLENFIKAYNQLI